jgi:hypothetical protein
MLTSREEIGELSCELRDIGMKRFNVKILRER